MIARAGVVAVLSLLLVSQPLAAQRASPPAIPPGCSAVYEMADLSVMPEGMVVNQTASGAMHGFGGALLGGLVIGALASGRGVTDYDRSTNWMIGFGMGAAGGYLGGSVVGVHRAGRRLGLTASPLASSGGATVGILGFALGPVGFLTVPYGAAIGYRKSARHRCGVLAPQPDAAS
jgi:hypothetical protein